MNPDGEFDLAAFNNPAPITPPPDGQTTPSNPPFKLPLSAPASNHPPRVLNAAPPPSRLSRHLGSWRSSDHGGGRRLKVGSQEDRLRCAAWRTWMLR